MSPRDLGSWAFILGKVQRRAAWSDWMISRDVFELRMSAVRARRHRLLASYGMTTSEFLTTYRQE